MNLQTSLPSSQPLPAAAGGFQPCRSECVGIACAGGEKRLVAVRRIAPGERLFRIEGEPTSLPTRYSLQIAENLHLDVGVACRPEEIEQRYFWRYLNHSCDPNTVIRQRDVVALRRLEPWEDVTFDYATTEYVMAEPFDCRCGSARCRGLIRGFRHLSVAERERLRPLLADHLRRHLESERPGGGAMPSRAQP